MRQHKVQVALRSVWLAMAMSASVSLSADTGQATVTRGDTRYAFVVIQCLRDQPGAFGNNVIEFQLDGVPMDTPPKSVSRLMGLLEAGDDIQAELRPVIEHGPILSITRVKGGGERVTVTDMASLMWISDGSPMDPDSRRLEIGTGTGARINGSTRMDGEVVNIEASCPG